ncbi:MAG: T9SS type A sorting domain-containing protein [Bacteroidetes bacterium]|nr:T9SS type A sorting domain-containing protein [Bacteroidota bacterium]
MLRTVHFPSRCLFACAMLFSLQMGAQVSFPLSVNGYDSHVELRWPIPSGQVPDSYKIYRSTSGQGFSFLKTVNQNSSIDFTGFAGDTPDTYSYFVQGLNGIGTVVANSDTLTTIVQKFTDNQLLDMVQRYTFRYFWDFGHPVSGMARERNSSGDVVTTGGTGFGVMAVLVGIERGFITRQEGRDRILKIVSFLQFADSFHGAFPHWMNGNTGNVIPFGTYDNGGDLVETAFLMEGLLAARQYFDQSEPYEDALRQATTNLWEDVEWDFYRKNNSNVLYWHWSPNYAWQMNFPIRGYNEAMMVYLLAIASPTHPVPASLWANGWASQNYVSGLSWYGHQLYVGPSYGGPLFFAHYSFLGFDPRNKKDAYANYFLQNKNHTLINRAFCIANPLNHEGYGETCWGLTASDDPFGYLAHAPGGSTDNGTISPTAALSSMPYTFNESMAALKHFYREHGERLWGEMGFYDAFNLDQDWFADSYLAIDQGPIIGMIENYRTNLLWNLFMSNPEIQPALDAIGFTEDLSATAAEPNKEWGWNVFPNPANSVINVEVATQKTQTASLDLFNANGQPISSVFKNKLFSSGTHRQSVAVEKLPVGVYFLVLNIDNQKQVLGFLKN